MRPYRKPELTLARQDERRHPQELREGWLQEGPRHPLQEPPVARPSLQRSRPPFASLPSPNLACPRDLASLACSFSCLPPLGPPSNEAKTIRSLFEVARQGSHRRSPFEGCHVRPPFKDSKRSVPLSRGTAEERSDDAGGSPREEPARKPHRPFRGDDAGRIPREDPPREIVRTAPTCDDAGGSTDHRRPTPITTDNPPGSQARPSPFKGGPTHDRPTKTRSDHQERPLGSRPLPPNDTNVSHPPRRPRPFGPPFKGDGRGAKRRCRGIDRPSKTHPHHDRQSPWLAKLARPPSKGDQDDGQPELSAGFGADRLQVGTGLALRE